jgi:hypothetical protein
MPMRILVPPVNLFRDTQAVNGLLCALAPAWDCADSVELDLRSCNFLSAEGAAVLSALKLCRERRGLPTVIDWTTTPGQVSQHLARWRVANHFGRIASAPCRTAVPLLNQPCLEPRALSDYLSRWVFSGDSLPAMSDELTKRTRNALIEVVGNIFEHAESPCGGLVIGQLYPNVKQFQLCVCDGGVGLARRVQVPGRAHLSACHAIQWAIEGHTTRQNRPGGLGLRRLRRFVQANGGAFRIYANDGCLAETPAGLNGWRLSAELPGTLIEIRLNALDIPAKDPHN